jgi:ribose transport system permease protein
VIVGCLFAGGFFGIINGLGVTKARLQPFIVTLATMTIATGLAFYLSKAAPVWLEVDGLADIQGGSIGPVPIPIVIFAIVVALGTVFLRYTVYGRELYAIGGNDEASHLSGIPATRRRLLVYFLSGLLSGLAAVILMSFTQTADPNAAVGYELASIAAVVVGGTTLAGGQGSVLRSTVGVLIIAFVNNIMILQNMSPWMQQMLTGFIVLIAVSLEAGRASGPGGLLAMKEKTKQLAPLFGWIALGIVIVVFVLKPMS